MRLEYKGRYVNRSRFINLKDMITNQDRQYKEWRSEWIVRKAAKCLKSIDIPVTKENIKLLIKKVRSIPALKIEGLI